MDSRYADFRALGRASILADNFSNGGLVYGAAVPNWEALDLGGTAIMLTEDGAPFADSSGGTARDPLGALVEFTNLMMERGGRERAPGDRDRDRSQRSTRQSLVCGE